MQAKDHNRILALGGSRLEIVPMEEVWETKEEGKEISLGYMSLWLEPNEIESVRIDNMGYHSIELQDGVNLGFDLPFEVKAVEEFMRNYGMTRKQAEEMSEAESFERRKEAFYTQPVSNFDYVRMRKNEQAHYFNDIAMKSNFAHDVKEVIIFDADQIQGIYHRGNLDDSMSYIDIFCRDSRIRQGIYVGSKIGVTEAEVEAKIKRILGSMRYLVEELPGEGELAAMVAEAVGRMKNDK